MNGCIFSVFNKRFISTSHICRMAGLGAQMYGCEERPPPQALIQESFTGIRLGNKVYLAQ